MSFNPAQQEAISHVAGPAMILAGPGSGKTTVITQRVRYLIEEAGVHPASILVVTFTRPRPGNERALFCPLQRAAHASQFWNLPQYFFRCLKSSLQLYGGDIITDSRRMELFRQIVEEMDLEIDDMADFIVNVSGEVSLVKGENMSLDHYYSVNCADDVFKAIYKAYGRKLKENRLIDFDDMLLYTWELFKARPDILGAWQKKFQYILIDEFQDINQVQYEIIRMMAAPENNLFIVGDDDQSIYRFRGARPEIMLGFTKDYPKSKTILLDINYRCTQQIVEGALQVIKNNRERYEKQLKAFHSGGEPIEVKMFNTMAEEYETLIREVYQSHKEDKMPLKDMAVLYRTNTGARLLVAKLMEYNIPFRMKDSVPNLFDHWIAKDIFAYIKAALGQASRSDYLRIINRPKRYISRQMLTGTGHFLETLKASYAGKDWALERLDRLAYDLESLGKMNPYGAVNYIRYGVGYDNFLIEYARRAISE